ncbi:hypothetical protein NDU88_002515 [Pleurodeles waltl]|uniref:Uncharacterized protein n=1 Tax=Pleurodeles waltl TaxID=8319 RepID=A0AAV7VCT7_PLEWA|nr:hypothetical protein NDU88_002515 [Pleurodeles waltl]
MEVQEPVQREAGEVKNTKLIQDSSLSNTRLCCGAQQRHVHSLDSGALVHLLDSKAGGVEVLWRSVGIGWIAGCGLVVG